MTALHVVLGTALIAVNALAAAIGGLAWRRATVPRGFWPLLRAGQALVMVEALDGAMAAAGFDTVTIKHGGGNLVTHWAVETANLFVIADGVQSIGEMKGTRDRFGIAFGWRTLPDGRQQSQLKLRAFLRELLEVALGQAREERHAAEQPGCVLRRGHPRHA